MRVVLRPALGEPPGPAGRNQEKQAGAPRHHYIVAVMSNVLEVNSAVAHQTLALRIQRLVQSLHADAPALPEDDAWPAAPVDDPGEPTFLKDGSFLLFSERDGWRHAYLQEKQF